MQFCCRTGASPIAGCWVQEEDTEEDAEAKKEGFSKGGNSDGDWPCEKTMAKWCESFRLNGEAEPAEAERRV